MAANYSLDRGRIHPPEMEGQQADLGSALSQHVPLSNANAQCTLSDHACVLCTLYQIDGSDRVDVFRNEVQADWMRRYGRINLILCFHELCSESTDAHCPLLSIHREPDGPCFCFCFCF